MNSTTENNLTLEWATPWGWVLNESSWGMLVLLAAFVVYIALSLDGCRLVFRGTRDYIHVTMGKRPTPARAAATVAALVLFFSSWAPLVTIVSWFAGVPVFARWPNPHNPNKRTGNSSNPGDPGNLA